MSSSVSKDTSIAVVGLGYVGLPLALALDRHFPVTGYDTSTERLDNLRKGSDTTLEVCRKDLQHATLKYTNEPRELAGHNIYIVTVPTPIDANNIPDLTAVKKASRTIGKVITPGAIIVFESTVFPGVTEDICGPEIEGASKLKCGSDFFLGYSPERINPGDKTHTVDSITKVIASQTPEVTQLIAEIYGSIIPAGIHIAPDIRTAEAAKVIENAQRDINIAFINEITMIFQRMGIQTNDILAAARTKWNFLDFRPGLVGGHCIGVDPYYLAHAATTAGHEPEIILAGRRINDSMANFIAERVNKLMAKPAKILVLGLTFKENVPDLRNSKIADLIKILANFGHEVDVHDPLASATQSKELYQIDLVADLTAAKGYDMVLGAICHQQFRELSATKISKLLRPGGVLADLKGIWPQEFLDDSYVRWNL